MAWFLPLLCYSSHFARIFCRLSFFLAISGEYREGNAIKFRSFFSTPSLKFSCATLGGLLYVSMILALLDYKKHPKNTNLKYMEEA